jgi:hypothetical protein
MALDALVSQGLVEGIRSFDARLRAPVFPGDQLTVSHSSEGVQVTNQSGAVVATITVELSS